MGEIQERYRGDTGEMYGETVGSEALLAWYRIRARARARLMLGSGHKQMLTLTLAPSP